MSNDTKIILSKIQKLEEKIDESINQTNLFYKAFANEIIRIKFNIQALEIEIKKNKQ